MDSRCASSGQIREALESIGVALSDITEIVDKISRNTSGLLLYGSRARGDYLPTSDFDILRLSFLGMPTFSVGNVSISSYTPVQLESASRTLYGTHIQRDGRVILDPTGRLREIVESLNPADPDTLIETVHAYSVVLNQPIEERQAHLPGLTRLARYLLRTAVYARSMKAGKPCFSVRELASRFRDPALATILASNPEITGPPSMELLEELVLRLTKEAGALPRNQHSSLQHLAVAMWDSDRLISALALRAEDENTDGFDYSDLPKVLL
ncbi:hypothetical protein GCM10009836_20360 [Pseudonocardia ailaonensis]|uniref:Polymerase nucleotidyl transferase domain-containing protein n=1 Tax=Pseudonocardia ailaonensis TaxID=367279 RepID=A0ABN2MWJ3_9PSEU